MLTDTQTIASSSGEEHRLAPRQWIRDVLILWALLAALIGVRAMAPSNTYAYAQIWHTGIAVDVAANDNWLVHYDQRGEIARKPQLWYWLTGAVIKVTGEYEEWSFRVVTVLSAFACAAMIYGLGVRWYGRRAGLLAGLMWPAMLLQFRMCYLAATDMLLTVWIIGAVMCIDRVLWHLPVSGRRGKWLVGFAVCMILAGLSKGLGVINWIVLLMFVGIVATCRDVGPGPSAGWTFGAMFGQWWRAIRRSHLWWAFLASALVVTPLLWVMYRREGQAFTDMLQFEYFQRATGAGDNPPQGVSVPPILYFIYYTLPVFVFALGAIVLEKPSRWFSSRGATLLPLAWLIAVLVPFSFASGFRPDYFLPCFPALALLGGWGADRLIRVAGEATRKESFVRHLYAATTLGVGLLAAGLAVVFLLAGRSEGVADALDLAWPDAVSTTKVALLWAMVPVGLAIIGLGIYLSLTWRVGKLVVLACVGMLAVNFVDGNFLSRHARTGDGDAMVAFAMDVRGPIADDSFGMVAGDKLVVEPYLGRFAEERMSVKATGELVEQVNAWGVDYIITCDRGLLLLGAATRDEDADYRVKLGGKKVRFRTHPEQLGQVVLTGDAIESQMLGKMYLIRADYPIKVSGTPIKTDFLSGAMAD
jgi:4-amino-4-deoxy-L-arabinose transferase-like glycosyltransferase